jgi:hypothetical protein
LGWLTRGRESTVELREKYIPAAIVSFIICVQGRGKAC